MSAAVQAGTTPVSPYQLKPGPYSSHSLLLGMLPERGEGRRVLDVGCASGYLASLLTARGYRVTGIDHAASAPGVVEFEFLVADLEAGLPDLPGPYDYVICADILEHLRFPDRVLPSLRDVLAPGGVLIASLPNSGHAYFRWNVLRGRFPAHDRGLFDRTHLHFYTLDGWRRLLRGAGFRLEQMRCSGVPVGLALPRWQDSPLVGAAESVSYALARLWPTLFAYQFIVRARPEARP